MTIGLILPAGFLLFSILVNIVYFSKQRLNNYENRIYKFILVINLISLLLEFPCTYFAYHPVPYLSSAIVKFYLLVLLSYIEFLTIYISIITKDQETFDKRWKIIKTGYLFFFCIFILFIIFGNVEFVITKLGASAMGSSVSVLYIQSIICPILWFINIYSNHNKANKRKFIPFFIYITLALLVSVVQYYNPGILLITPMETFVTMLMYFTIENPDLKMIAELELARNQAEKANAAKTDFLSNMSHEIRTPLNAIVGFSQSLSEEDLPDSTKEKARDILMASDNLLEIVNGVLDISKIEANKLEIVNTEYDIHKVFDELVLLTKARIGEKPIELRVHLDPSVPGVLYGDYVRLKQIILNLLTNAAKYTKEGFIDFKISTIQSGKVCRLIISVEDSGIGIKQDKINKLFMKFERLDLEKNITIEGTGLGLAITKKLVELMNGKIVVQSVYGKGSKFTVAIDQKIVAEKDFLPKEEESASISVAGKKVLLVDDNKLNLKVASMLLSKYELDITQVLSGFEAIDKVLAGEKYDLILLDDMMPKMSGVETLQKLKGIDGFAMPVVVLTANAISGMKEKYLQDGFQDYLAKPIDKVELEKVIRKYLN